jgi:hypothetical protein
MLRESWKIFRRSKSKENYSILEALSGPGRFSFKEAGCAFYGLAISFGYH